MAAQSKELQDLEQVRQRTLADIARLREALQAEIEPASPNDDDSADISADIYERGKIISLISSMEAKLHAVEHAIATAAQGAYGRCENCGNPIPPERLEIMPETTLCVNCAAKLEQGIRRRQIMIADEERVSTRLYDDEEDLEDEDEAEEEEDEV